MTVATAYEHVELDEHDVPFVKGTPVKIVELVLDSRAYGWSPAELHFQHPQLGLGEIHSALAYYWDHREEFDADIEARLARIDRLRPSMRSPLQSRLQKQV